MKEQVNREVCVTILDSRHATDIEKKLAGACLLLLDECESLRKDVKHVAMCHFPDCWTCKNIRLAIDAAISENAARERE